MPKGELTVGRREIGVKDAAIVLKAIMQLGPLKVLDASHYSMQTAHHRSPLLVPATRQRVVAKSSFSTAVVVIASNPLPFSPSGRIALPYWK